LKEAAVAGRAGLAAVMPIQMALEPQIASKTLAYCYLFAFALLS
jgi:hypothetical protein